MKKLLKFPVMVTRGLFIFPDQTHVVDVGRPKSVTALHFAKEEFNSYIICAAQKNSITEDPGVGDIYDSATLCQIKVVVKNKNSYSATILGLKRVKLEKLDVVDPGTWLGEAAELKDIKGKKSEEIALVRSITKELEKIAKEESLPETMLNLLSVNIEPTNLANSLANFLPIKVAKKALILKTNNVNKRLKIIYDAIKFEREISTLESKISRDVKTKISDNQREYYLREKIRSIQAELGEMENGVSDIDMFLKRINEAKLPKSVEEKLNNEVRKLSQIPSSSAEYSVVRTYLETMLEVPWHKKTQDKTTLRSIKTSLNKKHFGLDKVKQRIIEYIAVKQHTKSLKSPILCLVGPPGVGKTSLAYSIAQGLNRKFVKVSLGGIKDESEIRGHRKTYLGSMPGRIIKGMMKAKVTNPVFLLDEIDKMASDYKGDPSSALLEVLDPEQNTSFSDHYLEENYDLSNVMFIATANFIYNIPTALRDRLEIIHLSSYTEQEKVKIAHDYLMPKALQDHNITKSHFRISLENLLYIIRHYTREAGVRELKRLIDNIARKQVVVIQSGKKPRVITRQLITKYLGKGKYEYSKEDKRPHVGVVTGLAYTQFGGDILPVEVNYFEGKDKFGITGQLGDVMTESAKIALSYIKANANKFKISPEFFKTHDIHIHASEGAVPKDGPSAGITMTLAIYSALTKKAVPKNIAMTGEINLRGHVLAIGGLKEKAIAAHRSGIKKILIPHHNKKDLDDIPKEVRKGLKIISVKTFNEVLKNVYQ